MAVRFKRKVPRSWSDEEPVLEQVRKVCRGEPVRVMFPSTHDITPASLPLCLEAMEIMLDHGHRLLIVSKPHVGCIAAICEAFSSYRHRMLFRFTIGSTDDKVLRFWEPNAPIFMERLDALCLAQEKGFETSVSCEPMLDSKVQAVVDAVSPFVTDSIWIGKANQLRQRLRVNGHGDAETMRRAGDLIESQCDDNIKALHSRLNGNPKIKWKDSIKRLLGLEMPREPGMDV